MKKLLLLILPLMMLCACETGPKTYRYKDIAFDYPGNYKINNESINPDEDRCEVFLTKDGDNFIYLDLQRWPQDVLDELSDEELSDGLVEDAYNLYVADLEDDDMDFDDDDTSVDIEDNGNVIMAYGGKYVGDHEGDPFFCVITNRLYGNYEVITRSEAMTKEILAEMSDIVNSVRLETKE